MAVGFTAVGPSCRFFHLESVYWDGISGFFAQAFHVDILPNECLIGEMELGLGFSGKCDCSIVAC